MRTFTPEELKNILEAHNRWRAGVGGSYANLRGANLIGADLRDADLSSANLSSADLSSANLSSADLRDADLSSANLSSADLRGANLIGADLRDADLSSANLSSADLRGADLIGANLRGANLIGADLRDADLIGANLRGAGLIGANLSGAGLSDADLIGANLSGANLRGANLRGADLSGVASLPSAKDWLLENFKVDTQGRGIIVYRDQDGVKAKPLGWKFEDGAVLTETPNPDRCTECGCGVAFATLKWVKTNYTQGTRTTWECLVEWADLADVVVPFGTDGKARCRRLTLLRRL